MPRARKPIEVHALNGYPSHQPRTTISMAGSEEPLPGPPAALTPAQKRIWRRVRKQMPWLNATHASLTRILCIELALSEKSEQFFERRREEFVERGEDEALALLTDSGLKMHPLLVAGRNARMTSLQVLVNMGATPTSQARILALVQHQSAEDALRKSPAGGDFF